MAMERAELCLPEELFDALGGTEKVEERALQSLLLSLLAEGQITIRYAAKTLGMTYREMLDLMAEHKVTVANYDPDELDEELVVLRQLTYEPTD